MILKNLFLALILLYSTNNKVAFTFKSYESSFLFNLFEQTGDGEYQTLKLNDNSIMAVNRTDEIELIVPMMITEQCALECIHNMNCIRYKTNQNDCYLYLKPNMDRESLFDSTILKEISEKIDCDLNICKQAYHCLPYDPFKMDSSKDVCLCGPLSMASDVDTNCVNQIEYTLTEWSEWSACSVDCGQGVQQRQKNCLKKQIGPNGEIISEELIDNNKWLCDNNGQDIVEFKDCELPQCEMYSEWSEWSLCSRVCGGVHQRQRDCVGNNLCEDYYLEQEEVCGFSCSSLFPCNYSILYLKNYSTCL
jgi:hypothetical protein